MKSNFLIHTIFFLLWTGCKNESLDLFVFKIHINYPNEKLDWYHAPPQMLIVLKAINNSQEFVAIPASGLVTGQSLICSEQVLNLRKTSTQETIFLAPNEEMLFALESNFKEIELIMDDCEYDNPTDFFNQLFEDMEIIIESNERQIIRGNGIKYKVPRALTAKKAQDIEYLFPSEFQLD